MPQALRIASLAVAALLAVTSATLSAEKEDPQKFKYENIPVTATCLEGYHPTQDPKWGPVFPCIADAATVAPIKSGAAVKAAPVKAN